MANTKPKSLRYAAFISYSHRDDRIARWLHRFLEGYRIPAKLVGTRGRFGRVSGRVGKVFRDREEFSAGGELNAEIEAALLRADALIVICSPDSARSAYVDAEVELFVRSGRSDRIIPLIVGGEPPACFPPALRGSDRLAADVRKGKDGFRRAAMKVIAAVVGVDLDDLTQRDRVARRNRSLFAVTSAAVVVGAFSILGVLWNSAAQEATRSEGNKLLAAAREMLPQGEIATGLALLDEAKKKLGENEQLGIGRVIDAWSAQLSSPSELVGSSQTRLISLGPRHYFVDDEKVWPLSLGPNATLLETGSGRAAFAYSGDGSVAFVGPADSPPAMLDGEPGNLPEVQAFIAVDKTLAFSIGLFPGPTPGTSTSAFVLADLSSGAFQVFPMGAMIYEEGFTVLPECSGVMFGASSTPSYSYGPPLRMARIAALTADQSVLMFGDGEPSVLDLRRGTFVPFGLRRTFDELENPRAREALLSSILSACPRWTAHRTQRAHRLEVPSLAPLLNSSSNQLWLHEEIGKADFSTLDKDGEPVISDSFFASVARSDRDFIYLYGHFRGGIMTRDLAVCTIARATARLDGCVREVTLGGHDLEPNASGDVLYLGEDGASGLVLIRTSDLKRIALDRDLAQASRNVGNDRVSFSPDDDHFAIMSADGNVWTYRIDRLDGVPSRATFVASFRIPSFSKFQSTDASSQSSVTTHQHSDVVVRLEALGKNRLALFRADGAIAVIDILSGHEHWKLPGVGGNSVPYVDVALSPDGRSLGVVTGDVLRIVDLNTGLLMSLRPGVRLADRVPDIFLRPLYSGGFDNWEIDPSTGKLRGVPGTELSPDDIPSIDVMMDSFTYDRIRFPDNDALEIATEEGTGVVPLRTSKPTSPLACLIAATSESGSVKQIDILTPTNLAGCAIDVRRTREIAGVTVPTTKAPSQPEHTSPPQLSAQSNPSFNCANATTPVELAICASENLGSLDRQMSQRFSEIRRAQPNRRQELLDEQRAWLERRNRCQDSRADITACLVLSYEARLEEMRR